MVSLNDRGKRSVRYHAPAGWLKLARIISTTAGCEKKLVSSTMHAQNYSLRTKGISRTERSATDSGAKDAKQ